ncbi:MAG: DUF1441 family protein [bacterium]|nr:DUF1441 family protein [bacterium]
MAMQAQHWTISALSVELKMDRRTLARRLESVKPVSMKGRAHLYLMTDVFEVLLPKEQTSDEVLDLDKESARLRKAQADRAEIDLAEKRRELIPAEEAGSAWSALIGNARSQLLTLPERVARGNRAVRKRAKTETRALLEELSKYEVQSDDHRPDPPRVKNLGAAAGADGKRVGRSGKVSVPRGKSRARKVAKR